MLVPALQHKHHSDTGIEPIVFQLKHQKHNVSGVQSIRLFGHHE